MTRFRTLGNGSVRVVGAGCLASCALFALACGDLPEQGETDVVTETDSIINGAVVSSDSVGTPIFTVAQNGTSGSCTGTMIRKDWMLTAHHCVTEGELTTGGTEILPGNILGAIKGGPNVNALRVVRHPTYDVALVKMPTMTDGAGQTFVNPIYVGSNANLALQPVYMQGWGWSAITNCQAGNFQGTGTGLKSMTALINNMSSTIEYRMLPAVPGGQITFKGDSGGTPFFTVNGFRRPTGVASGFTCTATSPPQVTQAFFVRSDAFRGWLQGVVGTGITGGPISGFERADKASVIAYTNGSPLHVKMLAKGSSSTPNWTLTDLGGTPRTGSDVPSYIRSDGIGAVVYVNTANHVVEIRQGFNGSWISQDLTAAGGGSNVAAGGRIAAYVRSDSANSVVYGSSDGNIRELRRLPGATQWTPALLTSPGSPSGGNPVGYVRGDARNSVVYVDQVGHVQELTQFNGWIRTDLTNVTGAAAVASGAAVHVYSRSDGYSIILYRDVNQDIWELAMSSSGSWSAASLTSMFGCEKSSSDPYGYVRPNGINAVVYRGTDAHAREISLDGTWLCNDLSGATGAPDVDTVGPYGFVGSDRLSHVVYRSSDGHIRDLVLNPQWTHTDPTQDAGGL